MAVVMTILALVTGVALGWLAASRRGEATVRQALARAAALQATLEAEYTAAERREQLLLQADTQQRDVLGAQAAEALQRVRDQLEELQRGRVASDAQLQEQVRAMNDSSQSLRSEAAQLVTALRAPQVRGRWGEMQLERVVEAAGMTEHVDYVTQVSVGPDGNRQRPDLVVRLAGGKNVVVDAKVAFNGYLEAMEARDESTRDARLRAHARHLRTHVDQLAAKSYWERFSPTPEFVVCFLPADALLDAALRTDPTLLEHAFARNVVLATPSTLVALLRTVSYTWRQERLAANAAAVHELGRELYRRIGTLSGHVDRLGRSLGTAVSAYNDAVGSLERRVISTARQMHELGVVAPDTPVPVVDPVTDAVPRPLALAELVDPRVVPLHPPQPQRDRDGA